MCWEWSSTLLHRISWKILHCWTKTINNAKRKSVGQAPAQAHLHFFAQPFINSFPQQAMKTKIIRGDMTQNFMRKAFEVKEYLTISVVVIHPYKNLTFFFSNASHKENDCMTAGDSKLVQDSMWKSLQIIISTNTSCISNLFSWNILLSFHCL